MEYNAILKIIEDQKNERIVAGKMFRYSGLILAVDFFSQKLNSSQIMDAAFDFVNELLSLESSAIFYAKNGDYELGKSKGIDCNIKTIRTNERLKNLATLHGDILSGKEMILRYFNEDLFTAYNVSIVLPIIVDTELEGFILISEKATGKLDDDDNIISKVLMKLFNSAMENYRRYYELQNTNRSLDEKVFNLFAISQSSKALLSELNLEALYSLSIDVFSELTQSSSTGFVLYDEKSERYALKSFRFIYNETKALNIELDLKKTAVVEPNRIILDLSYEQDRDYFNNLFEDGTDKIKELMPQYLVLLNKDKTILGFVTLGVSVTGAKYKKSIFELIESLSSSTYISISNARHLKQVKEQKVLLQSKLDRLISLNNLMKNINSSNSLETLLEITVKTLNISFGAEKCLIALYDKDNKRFSVESSCGMATKSKKIKTNSNWEKVLKGRTTATFDETGLNALFGNKAAESFGDITSALLVPIYLDKIDIEILGMLIVFKIRNSIISDEENVLTMETIMGHIAPILHDLKIIEEQKKYLLPDYMEIFKNDLKKEISQAEDFSLELCVLKVINPNEFSFINNGVADKLKANFQKVYPFSYNTVFIISNEIDNEIEDKIKQLTGVNNLIVKASEFKKDFNTYKEFMNL